MILKQKIKTLWRPISSLSLGLFLFLGIVLTFGSPSLSQANNTSTPLMSSSSQAFTNTVFAPEDISFEQAPSFDSGRLAHAAILLSDGRVLFTGGVNNKYGSSPENSAELYDPASNTLESTGNLQTAHFGHSAIKLQNGQVLIFDSSSSTRVEVYDPTTGIFTFTGDLNYSRDFRAITLLSNGKVLVTGGERSELYDPETGAFTFTGKMNFTRHKHTATMLPDGQVLITGGIWGTWLNSAELYDPATESFSVSGQMQEARAGHDAFPLANGKVLLVSGTTTELYDWQTGTFT